MRENALMHGSQMERSASDPVGERRAIEANALALVNLRLAVERQVIGIFGDEHVRNRRFRRQAAFDQPRRGRRLDDDVLACAAGVFGSAHDQHSELRRHDIELLADVLANLVKLAPTARAGLVLDVDNRLDARQMRRQSSTVRAPIARRRRPLRGRSCLGFRSRARLSLLEVFEREQQLILRQRLGATAEAMALQFPDDLGQPFAADLLGDQHRLQCFGIVGKRVDGLRHSRDETIIRGTLRRYCSP